VVNALKHRCSF